MERRRNNSPIEFSANLYPCNPVREKGTADCYSRLISDGGLGCKRLDSRFRGNDEEARGNYGDRESGNGARGSEGMAARSPARPTRPPRGTLVCAGGWIR